MVIGRLYVSCFEYPKLAHTQLLDRDGLSIFRKHQLPRISYGVVWNLVTDSIKVGLTIYSALMGIMMNNHAGVHIWDLTQEQADRVLYVSWDASWIANVWPLSVLLDRIHHIRTLHFLHQAQHFAPISPPSCTDPLVPALDHDPHLH